MISTAYPHTILALFNNNSDEEALSPLLEGFPGVLSLTNHPDKVMFTENMA